MRYESLPHHDVLPLTALVGTFKKTTNSYKFYWFLALLKAIEEGQLSNGKIAMPQLFAKMIGQCWHTVALYKLSLGTMDKLGTNVANFMQQFSDTLDARSAPKDIEACLLASTKAMKELNYLKSNVPYRFLSTFFKGQVNGSFNPSIRQLCAYNFTSKRPPIYRFVEDNKCIELQAEWLSYLKNNLKILQDFCYLNLIHYLSRRNPNVPNISNKLQLHLTNRNLGPARNYWKKLLGEQKFQCIYSNQVLTPTNLSIDHFLPWSFVAHDMLWNLTPTLKTVNSSKNDRLPDLKTYLKAFGEQQYESFQLLYKLEEKQALEDYAIAFNTQISSLYQLPKAYFVERLGQQIEPLFQIAGNQGFQSDWIYSKS